MLKLNISLAILIFLIHSTSQTKGQIFLWDGSDQTVEVSGGTSASSGSVESYHIGGLGMTRSILQILTDAEPTATAYSSISGSNNRLSVSHDPDVASTVEVMWGYHFGDLNMDLTAYGNAFTFDYISGNTSAIGTQIYMTVWNDFTTYSTEVITLDSVPNAAINYTFTFADFGGADFTQVDQISFYAVMPASADASFANMTLTPITPVPEPSGVMMVSAASLWFITRRRRCHG